MEAFYGTLYDLVGGNPMIMSVFVSTTVLNVFYWAVNLFFIAIDLLQPIWAMPYKIQDTKMPKWDKYKYALKVAVINQTIVAWTGAYVISYLGGAYTGVSYSKTLPSWWTVLWQVAACILIEEVTFYYSHRLLHHVSIYKYIHKMHHEWTAPASITSIYAHPVEHVLSNLLPVIGGPTLLGAHITTLWIWACLALAFTTFHHSGYHFPFQPPAEFHDYHHKVFNENFGLLGVLDHLHGTSASFEASVQADRFRTTFLLKPIKEQYPDKNNKKEK